MTAAPWIQQLRLTAQAGMLALAAGTMLAGSPALAQTQEDDEDYNYVLNTDKRIFDTILGTLGLKSSSGGAIEYRERSPLVVPPARDLPPPEANAASKNPQWPVDPEVKEKKEAAARKRGQPDVDPIKPVGPVELAKGTGKSTPGDSYDGSKPALLSEPGFFKRMFNGGLSGSVKEEIGTFTGEPPRVTLTAPPPGYLTPSPAAPYGVTKRDDPGAYKKVER